MSSRRKEEPSQVSIGSGKGRHKGKVRRRSGRKPLGAQIRFISKLAVEKQEKKETKSTKTNTLSKGRGVARREAGISCPGTPRINISVYWICSRAYARTTTTTSKQKKKEAIGSCPRGIAHQTKNGKRFRSVRGRANTTAATRTRLCFDGFLKTKPSVFNSEHLGFPRGGLEEHVLLFL